MNWYTVVVFGALALFFFIFAQGRKETLDELAFNKNLSEGLNNDLAKSLIDTHNFTTKQELKRKMIHLLAILYVASWMLEPLVFYGVQFLYAPIANTATVENFRNAELLFEDTNVELILQNGLIAQFFMLICIFIGNANAEIMRLRFPEYPFILKRTLQTTRRPTEINDISGAILLLLGLATSSLILTYSPVDRILGIYAQMGVICIAVFSDMVAALVGRKWGKHKWWCVKGKSYEGTIAGFFIGFFTSMFFIGPFLALIGGLIFIFTDIALDKIKISDNASNPIIMGSVFKIMMGFVNPMIIMLPIIRVW
jgi:dolichol kinase